jgi:hypothetical protein
LTGIAVVGAGILVPLVASDGGPCYFPFHLRRLPVVLLPLLMPSLRQWFLFQGAYTYSVAFGELMAWIIGLGINHGICNWEYHGTYLGVIILRDYWTVAELHLPQWVQMDY